MHPELLKSTIELCKRRQQQGDCPIELSASVEHLENVVTQLAATLNRLATSRRWPEEGQMCGYLIDEATHDAIQSLAARPAAQEQPK